jgi:hypothetical protein
MPTFFECPGRTIQTTPSTHSPQTVFGKDSVESQSRGIRVITNAERQHLAMRLQSLLSEQIQVDGMPRRFGKLPTAANSNKTAKMGKVSFWRFGPEIPWGPGAFFVA